MITAVIKAKAVAVEIWVLVLRRPEEASAVGTELAIEHAVPLTLTSST